MSQDAPSPNLSYQQPAVAAPPLARVTVVDFDMSFGHLVMFFVKAAIAAIPAAIILLVIGAVVVGLFSGLAGIR